MVQTIGPSQVEVLSVALVIDGRSDDRAGSTVAVLEVGERHDRVQGIVAQQPISLGAISVDLETVSLEELSLRDSAG
jgi:hypothetical protein